MVDAIQRAIEKLNMIFHLSLDEFDEDVDTLRLSKIDYFVPNIDVDQLISCIRIFGNSIRISLRNLTVIHINGCSSDDEISEFREWLDSEKQNVIERLIVVLKKTEFLQNYCEIDVRYGHVLYFKEQTVVSNIGYDFLEINILQNKSHNFIILPFADITYENNGYITLIGRQSRLPITYSDYKIVQPKLEILQTYRFYCNADIPIKRTLPEQIYFPEVTEASPVAEIIKVMNSMSFLLLLHFIANASDRNLYHIRGYKNVVITNEHDICELPNDVLVKAFEIYKSIYENHTQDKLLITRNVFSIYMNIDSVLSSLILQLPGIFDSIHSNLDGYVRDKIKSFFDKKKDLEKYVRDTAESISKQINSVSDNVGKTYITLIGTLIAGIITYTAKGDTWLLISFVLLFGCISYFSMSFSIRIAEQEKESISVTFNHFVNLINELSEADKKDVIGDIVSKRLKLLGDTIENIRNMKRLILMVSLLLAFFLSIYLLSK